MFSQYAGEDEVLFPPMTMLVVQKHAAGQLSAADFHTDGSAKQFLIVDVLPCFL